MRETLRFVFALGAVAVSVVTFAVFADGGGDAPRAEATPFVQDTTYPAPPPPPGADTQYLPGDIPPDPYGGSNASARDVILQLLPPAPDPSMKIGDGSTAETVIGLTLRALDPPLSKAFSLLKAADRCAEGAGLFAKRGYRSTSDFRGGAIVIVSENAFTAGQLGKGCVTGGGDAEGGGPGGLTCVDHYALNTTAGRFLVGMAGVPGDYCSSLASYHYQLGYALDRS
jgi:hypothetical protein